MKRKRLTAAVLAGMLIFSLETGEVLARHVAEERGAQKQMERRIRAREALRREKDMMAQEEALAAERAAQEAAFAEERAAQAAEEADDAEENDAETMNADEELAGANAQASSAADTKESAEDEDSASASPDASAHEEEDEEGSADEMKVLSDLSEKEKAESVHSEESSPETESILGKYLRRTDDGKADTMAAEKKAEKDKTDKDKKTPYIAEKDIRLHKMEVDTMDVGGTLLFSDSPEYVEKPGITYSDIVTGDARILYYHVNETESVSKVAVVLENMSDRYAVVRIMRGGLSKPSADYLKVGRETQRQYFLEKQAQESLYIGAHEKRVLRESMDRTLVQNGELVYGLFDFNSTVPVRATVIVYPSSEDPLDFVENAPVLPKDGHRLRGTFPAMDRMMKARVPYSPKRDGAVYVTIGNRTDDAFKRGVDATDGSLVENTGNYGVRYHLEIPMRGKKKAAVWANPMGGVYTGATHVRTSEPAGAWMCMIPMDAPFFGHLPGAPVPLPASDGTLDIVKGTEMFCLGSFKGEKICLDFTPPGASNLPVRFILTEP